MDMEISNGHMYKDRDAVLAYSNGVSHDSSLGFAILKDSLNNELKDFEIKECKYEKLVEIPKVRRNGKHHPNFLGLKSEISMSNGDATFEDRRATKNKMKALARDKMASKYVVASSKTKRTVPLPFSPKTDKRSIYGTRLNVAEFVDITARYKSSPVHNMQQPTSAKQDPMVAPKLQRKPLQPNNKKHSDEDNPSLISSIVASARKLKKITVTSPPVFKSNERAERRKEFNSKLEEKHQALEAQKSQYEARTKEDNEAIIKKLRKSLLFKASPMPSFYHEGPPPKVVLKKPPPTRAISPKLGRRKSCSDSERLDKGIQESRLSFSVHRDSARVASKNMKSRNAVNATV